MANDWRQTVDAVLELQSDDTMKTAPGPSLQWYTRQYLSDSAIRLMGWAAQGIHMHFLMTAWEGFDFGDENPPPCSLPDDEPTLKALCHHPENWPEIWEQVRRGWKSRAGRLWSIGLCKSYLAQMDRRRKATASGRAGGRAKAANAASSLGQDLANASTELANASDNVSDAQSGPSSSSSSSSSPSSPDIQKRARKWDPEVSEIFAHYKARKLRWYQILQKKPPKEPELTEPDRVAIVARLKDGYSVERLEAALDNVEHDAWLMGQSERSKRHQLSLTTVLLVRTNGQVPLNRVEQLLDKTEPDGAMKSMIAAVDGRLKLVAP